MTMTAASMKTRIAANIAAITPVQGSGATAANSYRDAVLTAMCQGIIDEIKANATVQVTGVTAGGATANGTVIG